MPQSEPKVLDIKLFNQSTHYYRLVVQGKDVSITSNAESQDFNAYTRLAADNGRTIEDESITGIACLGNQHPSAVVRDMLRVVKWDKQTLKEYSMFTIGDFLITTDKAIYFAVNGDLVERDLCYGLDQVRGLG